MGDSAGVMGAGRAQYHLRQYLAFLIGLVLNRPQAMIPQAQNKFDANGELTGQTTCDFITAHLAAPGGWARRLREAVRARMIHVKAELGPLRQSAPLHVGYRGACRWL